MILISYPTRLSQAAVWSSYGRSGLGCSLSQLLLHLNTSDPSRGGRLYSGEATVMAMANVALALEGQGHATACDRLLDRAEAMFPAARSQHCKVWQVRRKLTFKNPPAGVC